MGRFYQYYNGFIFEFNSVGEYFKAVLWRIVGAIIGIIIVFLIYFGLWCLGTYGN